MSRLTRPYIRSFLVQAILRQWYGRLTWLKCFLPLSWLYAKLVARHLNQPYHSAHVPVWVVGNVVVGGGGKSPLVMWLAKLAGQHSIRCAVLMRGYLGQYQDVHAVKSHDDVRLVGDEALCLAKALPDMPIVLAKDRRRGLSFIKNNYPDIAVILADDGLQNRHLPKDIVWVCYDAYRGCGNGYCLPVGPLRSPLYCLPAHAQSIFKYAQDDQCGYDLVIPSLVRLCDDEKRSIDSFQSITVHALAGIASPQGFFKILEQAGLSLVSYPMSDHADLSTFDFDRSYTWVVTPKDAVKLQHVKHQDNIWVSEVILKPTDDLMALAQKTMSDIAQNKIVSD